MKLDDVAKKAAVNYANKTGDKQAALDPATIFTFIGIIRDVIELLKGCKKDENSGVESVKNPGPFQRIALRRHVKNELGSKEFRKHGEQVLDALYDTGKTISREDMVALYKEVDE
jgi:hypothetical protein